MGICLGFFLEGIVSSVFYMGSFEGFFPAFFFGEEGGSVDEKPFIELF